MIVSLTSIRGYPGSARLRRWHLSQPGDRDRGAHHRDSRLPGPLIGDTRVISEFAFSPFCDGQVAHLRDLTITEALAPGNRDRVGNQAGDRPNDPAATPLLGPRCSDPVAATPLLRPRRSDPVAQTRCSGLVGRICRILTGLLGRWPVTGAGPTPLRAATRIALTLLQLALQLATDLLCSG